MNHVTKKIHKKCSDPVKDLMKQHGNNAHKVSLHIGVRYRNFLRYIHNPKNVRDVTRFMIETNARTRVVVDGADSVGANEWFDKNKKARKTNA